STHVLIGIYHKNKRSLNDLTRTENMNKLMSYVLSELSVNRQTDAILLPIMNIDVSAKILRKTKCIEISTDLNKLLDLVDGGKADDTLYIEVKENFFKLYSLDEYIAKKTFTVMHWKCLFFEILHALYTIHNKYPGFRHNDLQPSKIYVYDKRPDAEVKIFKIDGREYKLPIVEFSIKLSNFHKSVITGEYDNSDISDDMKQPNTYYDIHFFMHLLVHHPHYSIKKHIDKINNKQLNNFINQVLPDKFIRHRVEHSSDVDKYKLVVDGVEKYPKIVDLLTCDFFADFLIAKESTSHNSHHTRKESDEVSSIDYNYDTEKMGGKNVILPSKKTRDCSDSDFSCMASNASDFAVSAKHSKRDKHGKRGKHDKHSYKKQRGGDPDGDVKSDAPQSDNAPAQPTEPPKRKYDKSLDPKFNPELRKKPEEVKKPEDVAKKPEDAMKKFERDEKMLTEFEKKLTKPHLGDAVTRLDKPDKRDKFNQKWEYKNTPFKTTDQKQVESKRFMEQPEKKKPEALFNIAVNEQLFEKILFPKQAPPPQLPPPMYGVQPYMGYAPGSMGGYPTMGGVPVIKQYNLKLPAPDGDHHAMATIFEDVLPGTDAVNSFNTLNERMTLYRYVRSFLVKQFDGEGICIDLQDTTSSKLNILNFIKLLNINPYHNDRNGKNPYKDMPDRMLLYSSCYPIRIDPITNMVTCARNSIGINIRIYEMSIGELNIRGISESVKYFDYDLWRDIAYYEYIREEIIKKKRCPNFVLMYSYHIAANMNIDFVRLAAFKNPEQVKPYATTSSINAARMAKELITVVPTMQDIVVETYKFQPQPRLYNLDENSRAVQAIIPTFNKNQQPDTKLELRFEDKGISTYNITGYDDPAIELIGKEPSRAVVEHPSGKCLVTLTEAPTINILDWATRKYDNTTGKILVMQRTGFHDADTWYSIYFQILAAMYILYKHGIAFTSFDLMNNVYIKDLKTDSTILGYWKYIIDGVSYYIPNYGYLVLVDSKYRDIVRPQYNVIDKDKKPKRVFKIYSNRIFMNAGQVVNDLDEKVIKKVMFNNLLNIVNPGNFSSDFTNSGGIKPPQEIIKMLSEMFSDAKTSKIVNVEYYIFKYMRRFMNNRVGTLLRDNEKQIFQRNQGIYDAVKGDMIVYKVRDEYFTWGIFYKSIGDNKCIILTKDNINDTKCVEKTITSDKVAKYSDYENVEQNYAQIRAKLGEDDLIEIYAL
ncbi:MAG: hypothetical protein Faunusvirus8_1, partial [Faunusvirus sp.]